MFGTLGAAEPAIVPQPVQMKVNEGSFSFTDQTLFGARGAAKDEAEKLRRLLAPSMGHQLPLSTEARQGNTVVLMLEQSLRSRGGEEGYVLSVTPQRIELRAASPSGLFYGGQTLRQLLPPEIFSGRHVDGVEWEVPCVEIEDYPRFAWRGLLIDPARHFIPVNSFTSAATKPTFVCGKRTTNFKLRCGDSIAKTPANCIVGLSNKWTVI
jgi:hexosaminidase